MKRLSPLLSVLLVAAGAAVYANSFQGPFVFDDIWSIRDNPTIRHLWPLTGPLTPVPGGITVSGRPVLNLSLAVNYAISGTAVGSYHVVNLVIHLLAAQVLFALAVKTLTLAKAAENEREAVLLGFAAALAWEVHPLQTESVTYVIQRAESLMGLLALVTLWAGVRSWGAAGPWARRGWAALSVGACLVGMGTKEVMVVVPVLVLAYDRTLVARSFGKALSGRKGYYAALACTWGLLAVLVMKTGNREGTAGFGISVSPWSYALIQVQVVTRYLGLAVWPHPLVFDYGVRVARSVGDVLPYACVLGPLLGATCVGTVRNRPWAYAGLWFVAILAPTSSFLPGNRQTMAEHRMYLPLAALAVMAVVAIHRAAGRRLGVTMAVAGVVAAALGTATAARNRDYRSSLALYEGAVAQCPDDAYAWFGKGAALLEGGQAREGLECLDRAVALDSRDFAFHVARGQALLRLGRPTEAARAFEAGFARGKVTPQVEGQYGMALVLSGRGAEGIGYLEEAARRVPEDAAVRGDLAEGCFRAKRWPEAIREYRAALAEGGMALNREERVRLHAGLADAMALDGDAEGAAAEYAVASGLAPESGALHANRGSMLAALGRNAEALAEWREALRIEPGNREAKEGIAFFGERTDP